MKLKLTLAITLIAIPGLAKAQALDLICHGTATRIETTQTYGSIDTDDGRSASGESTTYRKGRSSESMRVRIDDAGAGKVKLPAALIPPISRGKDGWWDLTNLSVTETAIRGQFSLNILNHPNVLIDRQTGDIDMKGLGMRFNGSCERAAEIPDSRKF